MKALFALVVLAPVTAAWAADWPQWRGPDRTAVSRETGLLRDWPPAGPEQAWVSREAGRGFGGPAVVGDRVYVLGALGGGAAPVEHVIALDAAGKKLWATPIAPAYDFRGNAWSLGPNSTPAVDGRNLFALGSQGVFVCVDTTGKERWRKDLVKDMKGRVNPVTGSGLGWGYNWSPLVAGNLVVIAPGGDNGLLAALDKSSGAVVWQSKAVPDDCTYSSPVLAEFDGVPQIVYAAQAKVYGVALKDGGLLWAYEKKRQAEEIVAPTPIVHDGRVFVSASAAGSELIRVSRAGDQFRAETVWDTKEFANLHGGVVLVGGHLYGSHETRAWKCLDLATGTPTWEGRNPGPGSVVAADGRLYCVSQNDGTVTLVETSPEALRVRGRFTLPEQSRLRKPSGLLWTHPVVANGRLYLRDQELVFCYAVKK
ncbi:MAG TPA: PQQ-binding-like beta-propeller repeat protein [Gemmataceae bacterium]|jgi:outer membrane protein assembly factor BamB